MSNDIKPLFIFSLPRSGSTLLQRILGSHENIATTSEPWILLPHIYTLKHKGVYTEYWHNYNITALQDFCNQLPNGEKDYWEEIQNLIIRLYTKAAHNNPQNISATYFLDKTPRYTLIAEEIIQLFPNAKFIFLWRHPIAIISSILETWENGRWKTYKWKIDIFQGLNNMILAYQKHSSIAYSLSYENLIVHSERECQKICDYLNLPVDSNILSKFNSIELNGTMGDPTGTINYNTIDKLSLEKWKYSLVNIVRKKWCIKYLQWIGKDNLSVMGYDLDSLIDEINTVPVTLEKMSDDIFQIICGIAYCIFELQSIKEKINTLPNWHLIHHHM